MVSRPLKNSATRNELDHEDIPRARDKVERLRHTVKSFPGGAGENMEATQASYKRDHVKRVRPLEQAKTG